MKFYLSSYKIGNEYKTLQSRLSTTNKKVAYISNALDFSQDMERRQKSDTDAMDDLRTLWCDVTAIDLRDYFSKQNSLQDILSDYAMIRVRWGNTFVLRQAMQLSGMDKIIVSWYENKKDIIYGWFSAAACILAPILNWIDIVDDPDQKPYGDLPTIRDGLNILPYSVAPHYRSDHPESADVEKQIQAMIDNKMLFVALRDGEVIIIDS